MKHIKKRFLLEFEDENEVVEKQGLEGFKITKEFDHRNLDGQKNRIILLVTDTKNVYGGFVHKVNNKNFVFPVPDPTLIYFHNAQISIAKINAAREKLLKKLDFNEQLNESAINEIYEFYGETSSFVIYLFTSIESFTNQLIPDDYVFIRKLTSKTESFDKNQIQDNIDFKTKIKEVLKDAKGKGFFDKDTPINQHIWNLKEFRNDIIHTKPKKDNVLWYDNLIKKSLNFKYTETLESVAKFMNFYKPDYIVECDCGKDF